MDETQTATENKSADANPNNGEGIQSETGTLIEQTDKRIERIEAANKKTEELLNRQEEAYTKQKLGGQTEAGQPSQEISAEKKKSNNAEDFFKGTALGDAIKKTNE